MGGERIRWALVVDRATRVAVEYGGAVTLRQLYYRLVAAQVIPHTAPTYRRLSARLAAARRQGAFPPLIVDALRRVHVPPCWPDAGTFLAELPALFALDRTTGQPVALYVGAEKDTLRAMFTGWLAEYGIPVLVVRGFGSQSYADQVAARVAADPRPAVLLYVGDHDASGADVERDWVARTGCWAEVERVALTVDQVAACSPRPSSAAWTGRPWRRSPPRRSASAPPSGHRRTGPGAPGPTGTPRPPPQSADRPPTRPS